MEQNKIVYNLDLTDAKDLARIKKLLDNQFQILTILNEDSEKSIDGGATSYYTIKLEIEEKWV